MKKSVLFFLAIAVFICSCFTGCGKVPNPVLVLNFGGGVSKIEGTVEIEMYPDKAPNTVRNIIYLAEQGFYNKTKVNMAVENSFIEIADGTGLKTLKDTGKAPDYSIKGEFPENGFNENDLEFDYGMVAMSRYEKNDYDSATDGFFITLGKFPEAQGKYAIFGKVIKGMEIIEEISHSKTVDATLHYEPAYSVIVQTAEVQKMGGKYAPPDKAERKYYVWNSYNPWWTQY